MKHRIIRPLIFSSLFVFAVACKDDEPPLPDNILQFEVADQGFPDTQDELAVKLTLSRALESNATAVIDLAPTGLAYDTEFVTQPAATNNSISLTLPAGSTEAILTISKKDGIFLTGSESLKLTLKSITNPVLVGTTNTANITFSSIVSAGAELTLNGIAGSESGTSARNSIYVDFSNNQMSSVLRPSWDFGFYSGADFRVILNNTTSATAKVLNKTDLNAVVAADTVPTADWTVGAFDPKEITLVDDVTGDLTKTVIAEVSATEADNKVYIVNRGTGGLIPGRSWLKIRILRKNSTTYTLQYAKITDTSFQSIDVAKDAKFNFVYLSVDGATASKVSVEPEKADWDIKWGYQMSQTPLSPGVVVPYASSDFVTINFRAGVQAAEVLTNTVAYDAFSEANIAGVAFKSTYDVIGTNWRTASQTPGGSGVKKDRFYVVKDGAGNVYKIKFLSFHGDEGGTRGKPTLAYQLVKKGA